MKEKNTLEIKKIIFAVGMSILMILAIFNFWQSFSDIENMAYNSQSVPLSLSELSFWQIGIGVLSLGFFLYYLIRTIKLISLFIYGNYQFIINSTKRVANIPSIELGNTKSIEVGEKDKFNHVITQGTEVTVGSSMTSYAIKPLIEENKSKKQGGNND